MSSVDPRAGAIDRVRRVLAVARRLADPGDPLGREARARLPVAAHLTAPGVELALTECLEREASDLDLASLAAHAGGAPRTWVVASANVCTAAARAIAFALATSPEVLVRPSRRDPVLAELVVRGLEEDLAFARLGASVRCTTALAPLPGDEVHAYGSDATMAAIEAALPAGVSFRGHGTGFGIAIVGDDDDLAVAARALAADVVPFDQRGCLSPRVVLLEDADRVERFAEALDRELTAWHLRVPRAPLDEGTLAELAAFAATFAAVGRVHEGEGHLVALAASLRALALPPASRAVLVVAVDPQEAARLLAPVAPLVAAIGGRGGTLLEVVAALCPGARRSALGRMQRPPLDGPVDLRGGSVVAPAAPT